MNEHSTVHWQWSFADCRWYSTPPLVSLLVLVNMSTSHRFFATSSIGCQCLRGYNWLLTAYEAPGLRTSVALPAQSLTIQAVLVSTWLSVCSMNQNNQVQKVELLHRSSSCLELTATSLSFPSIRRSQFQAGLKTHLFRLAFHWLFLWELLKRLNWTTFTLTQLTLADHFCSQFWHYPNAANSK